MNNDFIAPSTALLPMDDIATELEIKYGFTTNDANSKDTNLVAGINSNLIAIAATDKNGQLVQDRETINNALNLGGRPEEDFLKTEDAQRIENITNKVSGQMLDQFTYLKDELYQLKEELIKKGFIKDTNFYSGFCDTFKSNNLKFKNAEIFQSELLENTSESTVESIRITNVGEFTVNDYVYILKETNEVYGVTEEEHFLVKVTGVELSTSEITFAPAIASPLYANSTKIFKSRGNYYNGTFSFSELDTNVADESADKFVILNDDWNLQNLAIKKSDEGYANVFTMPIEAAGALSKYTIKAQAVGSPGALTCYVLPYERIQLDNNGHMLFESIKKEIDGKYIIGISTPLVHSGNTIKEYTFNFKDETASYPIHIGANTEVSNYPVLEGGKKYCFVIESKMCTEKDRWELFFVKGDIDDIKTNNESYYYTPNTSENPLLDTIPETNISMNRYDLYFKLNTKEIKDEIEIPYTNGIYTSLDMELPTPLEASRIRATMRINREGLYNIKSPTAIYQPNDIINVWFDKESQYKIENGLGFNKNDLTNYVDKETIVVGTNIANINASNGTQIMLDKALAINNGDSIYRVGYEVWAKVNAIVHNPVTERNEEVRLKRRLDLIAVMPDGKFKDPRYSDRLVFEVDLKNDANEIIFIKDYELQIKWSSNMEQSIVKANKDLVGRIASLSVTLEKGL